MMRWYLLLAVVVLAGLVAWLVKTMGKDSHTVPQTYAPAVEKEERSAKSDQADAMQPWHERKEVETLCREFVSAKTVEQILPLIRDRERLETAVRGYYPDGNVPGNGLAGLNLLSERAEGRWKAATLLILTKDFARIPLNVCQTENGLKVDWESWVGYSPVPWAEIMEKKPDKPVLVRVLLSDVPYYNMDFTDDTKWSSFRMLSPNGEHVLYGYVRRGSEEKEQLSRISPSNSSAESRATVMIRFPQDAQSPNQVIIDRVVADTWLILETKP